MISAQKLTKKFGNILALDAVSFDIAPGEFVFLTGPSGSGKTTVLRLIMRDLKPDAGKLVLFGPAKIHEYRRTIGTVFQDFKLLLDRNVYENTALPLEIMGAAAVDIDKAVKKALELMGLTARTDLFPAQLSGGELQRAALARAIVARPKLILADEPISSLDPVSARCVMETLRNANEAYGITVVSNLHQLDYAREFCSRVIGLNGGRIVYDGPPDKLCAATVSLIYHKEQPETAVSDCICVPFTRPSLQAAVCRA